jgi:cell division control protein 45
MLITKADLKELFDKIIADGFKGGCSIMVFVANNCDALCASKILTELFKQNNVQYTTVPVFSYNDIEDNLKEENLSGITSLIFLN